MKIYSVLFILAGVLFAPTLTRAFEIDYASVEDIAGDTVLLKYRTTDDYTFARCSFSGECGEKLYGENIGSVQPTLFPTILNQTNYTQSPDGTHAVVNFATLNGQTYRSLHRIDGDDDSYLGLVPYKAPALRTSITYANDAVIFLGTDGVIARFDIETGDLESVATSQTSFPFWSSSEHGNFIAWYSYTTEAQVVLNLKTGGRTLFSTQTPSYAVFNDSETSVAYLKEVNGFNKLFVTPIVSPLQAREVSAGDHTVVEYEFVGDMLYYIANSERDPYEWNLYSYDPTSNERLVIDSDVAYDDEYTNLKKTQTALLYEKVNGTHKDVVVFEPEEESSVILRASDVRDREMSEDIDREVVDIAGVPGVLLSPEDPERNTPLIVWLHGGPMRQTSLGFHPFYGYAVYDELLERFAEEAYDDEYTNLKKTQTALLYEKVNGTHKDVVVFEPEEESSVILRASDVRDREMSEDIDREVVDMAGVPGVLLSPEDPERNTPLIVWLHGGPMRQTSLGFHPFYGYAVYDELLERFAEEAYVLKLDYAGSWGHGNNRLEALQNQIGVADVRDVLRAIEEVKEEYDISDVHLFGPSYGGYVALRTLVESPEEIESVVSIAGVTDWTSLISRIPSSIFTRQFSGVPSSLNFDEYAAASVRNRLSALDNQKILLIYGEDDATVPTWQSKEFYAYARALGTNVELVGYEDEGHTILRKENLRDVCERTAETFGLSVSLCEE